MTVGSHLVELPRMASRERNFMFRIRFSLRWFLLGTTLVAVLIGTVGKRTYDDWQRRRWFARQQRISEDLKSARSGVQVRDGRIVGVQITPATDGSQAMAWLKDASELETLSTRCPLSDNDVAVLNAHSKLRHLAIDAPGRLVTNDSLRSIGQLGNLQSLLVGRSDIDDNGLSHLAGLKELASLRICAASIQGRGLIHLAELPKLQFLGLSGCPVNDDGVAGLADCNNLAQLWLDRTLVHGKGLASLKNIPNLTQLRLSGTVLENGQGLAELDQVEELDLSEAVITPGVLVHLAEMESLTRVNLLRARISDAHLAELKDAHRLLKLELAYTGISDAGLVHLRKLTRLTEIGLRSTAVTESAARRLSQDLRAADISFGRDECIFGDPKLRFEALQPQR